MRFVKPLDKDMVLKLASNHKLLVTLEENSIAGGAGSGVAELLAKRLLMAALLQLGLPDKLIDHANHKQQLSLAGLDSQQIIRSYTSASGSTLKSIT